MATTGTALAGCLGRLGLAGPELPDECPVSQDLDVEWPDELDRDAVASFVTSYENAYYREVVVEYEPETPLDRYELGVAVLGDVASAGDGYRLEVSGNGGIYRPNLAVTATAEEAPDGVDPAPADQLDGALAAAVEAAAADPEEEVERLVTDRDAVADHAETLEDLTDAELSGSGDSVDLYVDADGTTVELSVSADGMHGDYTWRARYYVDRHVLRRTTEEGVDPAEGDLLECRTDP